MNVKTIIVIALVVGVLYWAGVIGWISSKVPG